MSITVIHESGSGAAVTEHDYEGIAVFVACRYAGEHPEGPVWEVLVGESADEGLTTSEAQYASIGPTGTDGSEFEHPVEMLRIIATHLAAYAVAWAEIEEGMPVRPEIGLFPEISPDRAWVAAQTIVSAFGLPA